MLVDEVGAPLALAGVCAVSRPGRRGLQTPNFISGEVRVAVAYGLPVGEGNVVEDDEADDGNPNKQA